MKPVPRTAPLRPGDSPGRLPGDRPVRFDDVYETGKERLLREFNEWNAKGPNTTKLHEDARSFLLSPESKAFKNADLARRFGVKSHAITRVRNGETSGVGRGGNPSTRRVLTDEQVRKIRALNADGATVRDIADELGFKDRNDQKKIRDVLSGVTYKDVT